MAMVKLYELSEMLFQGKSVHRPTLVDTIKKIADSEGMPYNEDSIDTTIKMWDGQIEKDRKLNEDYGRYSFLFGYRHMEIQEMIYRSAINHGLEFGAKDLIDRVIRMKGLPQYTADKAYEIMEVVSADEKFSRRQPTSIAAAASYIASLMARVTNRLTQREAAEYAFTTETTVRSLCYWIGRHHPEYAVSARKGMMNRAD